MNERVLGEYWLSHITGPWNEYGVGKVNMANGGSGWTFTSFDLGKLTLTAGVHTLSICGVDVDSESPCVMDRLVLVPTNP